MKAEIFYWGHEQRAAATKVKNLSRIRVYPDLSADIRDVNEGNKLQGIAWRYMKLLRAAIPPEKHIKLVSFIPSNTVEEIAAWKAASETGTTGTVLVQSFNPYSPRPSSASRSPLRTASVSESFFASAVQKDFFPAMAIHGRMVLVPKGFSSWLETRFDILAPFNPLDMGGVEEVAFNDDLALTESLNRISETLRNEVLGELRAYAVYANIDKITEREFPRIARDLDIEIGFLRYIWRQSAGST